MSRARTEIGLHSLMPTFQFASAVVKFPEHAARERLAEQALSEFLRRAHTPEPAIATEQARTYESKTK